MCSDWLRRLAAKAFAVAPDEPIWQWADREVFFQKKHAAEPRYRSAKAPWTRWLQEIAQNPWRMRKGRRVRIRRVRVKKCTQSGFTEGILNIIRWCAKFAPRNFIYAINSKEEAVNIRERLVDTLTRLGEGVLADGDAPEDLQRFVLRLAEMIGWFLGSYSEGAFANKYAPLVIAEELDDHATFTGNASTLDLLDERLKTADDEDLSIATGKPQAVGGPIDKAHAAGDQFEWMVPCPHCGTCQLLEWERVRFGHCKDLLDVWDRERVLNESYYECRDGCHILDSHKEWMEERGRWWLTEFGDPETVSLHIGDIHSMHKGSTFGHLALEFIDATAAAKKGDLSKLQAFFNGRLGLGFEQRVEKIDRADVLSCRAAYRRGIVPQPGLILAIGMDVGQFVNTKWVTLALQPATVEAWVIDYGTAGQPSDLLDLMRTKRYRCPALNIEMGVSLAFIDCRFVRSKVFAAAMQMPRRIWPTLGLKPGISTRSIAFNQVAGFPSWFGAITFIRQDANSDFYLDRVKHKQQPRIHLPEDSEEEFIDELCAERLIKDPITGRVYWAEKPSGPNHWGDAITQALTGYDFLVDGPRTRAAGIVLGPDGKPAKAPDEPLNIEMLTTN